jgi:hypothetical protein
LNCCTSGSAAAGLLASSRLASSIVFRNFIFLFLFRRKTKFKREYLEDLNL